MAPASPKEAWSADPDMENRDPNNLNDHLKVTFEETIGEPDHTHSIECVWKYAYKCFNMWKTLCYLIVTTICGIPIASCWGCYFACVAFMHIWEIVPCIGALRINMGIVRKFIDICSETFVDPCCSSCGKLFSAWSK